MIPLGVMSQYQKVDNVEISGLIDFILKMYQITRSYCSISRFYRSFRIMLL